MATLASMTGSEVVLKVRNTADGPVPQEVSVWEAVNGWLKMMEKWTVYRWDCPPLLRAVRPQKWPLVSDPATSLSPMMWALDAKSGVWLSCSLIKKSAAAVRGKVNRPSALCAVAVNCEVIVSGAFDCAE